MKPVCRLIKDGFANNFQQAMEILRKRKIREENEENVKREYEVRCFCLFLPSYNDFSFNVISVIHVPIPAFQLTNHRRKLGRKQSEFWTRNLKKVILTCCCS